MVDYHEGSGSSRLPSGTAKLVYNHKIMAKFESVGFREFKSFHNLFLKSGFNFRHCHEHSTPLSSDNLVGGCEREERGEMGEKAGGHACAGAGVCV
jgi:hypothetical protein